MIGEVHEGGFMPRSLPLARPVPPELIAAAANTDLHLICPDPGAFTALLRKTAGNRYDIFKFGEPSPKLVELIDFAANHGKTPMARSGVNAFWDIRKMIAEGGGMIGYPTSGL
jgi:hypothetical protein